MIELNLTKLSVLVRVAEAYAKNNIDTISENAKRLYPSGKYPFALSKEFPLPLHLFSPRLSAMLTKSEDNLDAFEMWNMITARENLIRMMSATEIERTAAESLGKQFEIKYKNDTNDQRMKRKQMIGYMIKVAMECFGYLVYSKRMQVNTLREGADPEKRRSNFFTTASRYALINEEDIKYLLLQIEDDETRTIFDSIIHLIISGNTEYQNLYQINKLSCWDVL